MTVLQEILEWSKERPLWQRDALRRLVVSGELTDDDIAELTAICKGEHGLADKAEAQPLAEQHVPEQKEATSAVSLESICHHKGVNALAENQTVTFSGGLTIVYGDNGSGKSGSIRILLALKQFSEQVQANHLDQHVRRQSGGAGVCASELPWVAMEVKGKIGYLKNQQVEAEKLSKEGNQDAYEYKAKYLYGLLRETWERAVEEVLLNGLVERYRPSVQTQRLAKLPDITEADCQTVDIAMSKCSTWADIEALETWVRAIRKRRERATKGAA